MRATDGGLKMTTVPQQPDFTGSNSASSLDRYEHRFSGMLIAAGASVALWALLGSVFWVVLDLFD